MNTTIQMLNVIIQTFAASANIFLIASAIGLPLKNIDRLIRSSPYSIFAFVLAYASSNTSSFIPAILGTTLYFFLEFENIQAEAKDSLHNSVKNVQKKYNSYNED